MKLSFYYWPQLSTLVLMFLQLVENHIDCSVSATAVLRKFHHSDTLKHVRKSEPVTTRGTRISFGLWGTAPRTFLVFALAQVLFCRTGTTEVEHELDFIDYSKATPQNDQPSYPSM